MTLYVLITLLVLAGPLALSFDRRVAFYTHWKSVFSALAPVSTFYIIWDILVTVRGDWSFNPEYSGTVRILHLPLGEWLFFIVVPYACLFIYEVVKAYFPSHVYYTVPKSIRITGWAVSAVLAGSAVLFRSNDYTILALLSAAVWLVLTLLIRPRLLADIHTLWFFLLSMAAFLLINGFLTGIPIVLYNEAAIWGVRVFSIPLEDFFYNISMLGFYLLLYTGSEQKRKT